MRPKFLQEPNQMRKTIDYANFVLIVLFLFGTGCGTSGRDAELLKGWTLESPNFPIGKPISDDYHDYIQRLPDEQRGLVDKFDIWFHKNSVGQIAVEIKIPLNGTWWEHFLIYDQNGKRIKTIKFKAGRYMS